MPTTFEDIETAVFGHFASAWIAAGALSHEGGTIDVPVRSENVAFGPLVFPWVELDILWGDRLHTAGPRETAIYEARGTLQVNCYVPEGWGTALVARMADRAAGIWGELSQPGFKIYGTTPGRPLPAPPDGFYGRHTDTRFLWISGEGDPFVVMAAGIEVVQPGHPFTVAGQLAADVAGGGGGRVWALAQANGTDPNDRTGLTVAIVTRMIDSDRFRLLSESGVISQTLGLSDGTEVYTSQSTGGGAQATPPPSGFIQRVGRRLPGGLLAFHLEPPRFE